MWHSMFSVRESLCQTLPRIQGQTPAARTGFHSRTRIPSRVIYIRVCTVNVDKCYKPEQHYKVALTCQASL